MKLLNEENVIIHKLSDLDAYCAKLIERLPPRAIVLLRGDLGVGKTKTVEVMLNILGVKNVSSPTFAIHHSYKAPQQQIDHFDLYRIEGEADLESTGFWDIFSQNQGWVFIEWPERLNMKSLPKHWTCIEIELSYIDDKIRQSRSVTTKFYS